MFRWISDVSPSMELARERRNILREEPGPPMMPRHHRDGGDGLLLGCVVALCDVARAWSLESDESVARVLFEHVR